MLREQKADRDEVLDGLRDKVLDDIINGTSSRYCDKHWVHFGKQLSHQSVIIPLRQFNTNFCRQIRRN